MTTENPEENNESTDIHSISYDDESLVWRGSPSQWLNFGTFFFYGLLWISAPFMMVFWHVFGYQYEYSEYETVYDLVSKTLLIAPPLIMFWAWLKLKYEVTEITKNQIKESNGITPMFRTRLYCEISDVIDFRAPPAGWLGLIGRSTLILETKDKDQPRITIRAVKDREKLISMLKPLFRNLKQGRKSYFSD